jgi:CheY-like chemotaxis protein
MEQRVVLYIEDNYHNRRLVRKALERRGYVVLEAEDGIDGLKMVSELEPPLVLLDVGLPGMDGLEVVARIKADESLCHIPVIALTASAMRGDRERFLAAGCDDYLSKPIQVMDLVDMVAAHYPSNGHHASGQPRRRAPGTPARSSAWQGAAARPRPRAREPDDP